MNISKPKLLLVVACFVLVSIFLIRQFPASTLQQANATPERETRETRETSEQQGDGGNKLDRNSARGQSIARSEISSTDSDDATIPASTSGASGNTSISSLNNGDDVTDPSESDEFTLSPRVLAVIQEVQRRQLDEQWEEALNEMNALYEEFDELNPFEQTTLLNYYTNALLANQMFEESITAFTQMLTVQDLRPDINARALLSLGQLHTRSGDSEVARSYLEQWLDVTADMEGLERETEMVNQLLGRQ